MPDATPAPDKAAHRTAHAAKLAQVAFFARRKARVHFAVPGGERGSAEGSPGGSPGRKGGRRAGLSFATPPAAARAACLRRVARLLAPMSPLTKGRDHACCLLCLYEVWALPLRLAVGTAYNLLGPSQCGPDHNRYFVVCSECMHKFASDPGH